MKLVLIDGHSLAYRAFFALPPDMANSKGELTNAVYGFTSMLLNVIRDHHPTHMAVAFDVGRSFRHDKFEAYKATRERIPDELAIQIDRIQELIRAFRIPIFTREGYEADDVLATLAHQAEPKDVLSLITTGDRDLLQVVDEKIWVLTSGRKFSDVIIYTPEKVRERYQLSPRQIVDYKALVGDKSDNIPGVRGIGDKTAVKLLHQWGDLDTIYAHIDEVTPTRVRNALLKGKEDAYLSRALATIVDVPDIELDLAACEFGAYDRHRILELFTELEFRTLIPRLPEPPGQRTQQLGLFGDGEAVEDRGAPAGYRAVTTPGGLQEVVPRLQQADPLAFDVEPTGVDEHRASLVGLALGWDEGPDANIYVPVTHKDGEQLTLAEIQGTIGPVLADENTAKLAHNAKYDLIICRRHGLPVNGRFIDTMIGEFLLDPGSRSLGLKALAIKYLGIEMTPIADLIGKGRNQTTMDTVSIGRVTDYAAADVDMTRRIWAKIEPQLQETGLMGLFQDLEMPLIPVLADMEMHGVLLDATYLNQMAQELRVRLEQLAGEIYEYVGYEFNLNSTQQLSDALFGTLGLPTRGLKKTKSGHYSTAASVLEGMRGTHPVMDLLLEYRQLTKLLSTYVEALPRMINPETGRIHTSFDQTGAETGRISSNNPNLQNIPVRSELGRRIRKAFIAPPDHYLLAVDYSQVELRILAHISGDERMLEAFAEGLDIHAATASLIYGVPIEEVTSQQRSVAKMMNFATSYGVSPYGLSTRAGISMEEARHFMDTYFATYPGVKRYLEETIALAKEQGYVETLLGRRRYFPVLKSTARVSQQARAAAERAAINFPIQGSAADILKIALREVHRKLRKQNFAARMILQVHDELVLETPITEMPEVTRLVVETMEAAYPLKAPLKAEPEFGPNWYDMKPWQA
jgi:DNA polymerase-1